MTGHSLEVMTASSVEEEISTCLLCGSPGEREQEFELFLALPGSGEYRVFHCETCGFHWLDPMPQPEFIEQLYSQQYFEQEFQYAEQVASQEACYRQRILKMPDAPPSRRLLDVGCATGEFLAMARDYGFDVRGLEVSDFASARAREKGLNVTQGTLDVFENSDQRFDVITCSHVLEHLPSPRLALQQMHDLLGPKGLLYIEVPYQYGGLTDVIGRMRGEKRAFGLWSVHHRSFFTPHSLSKALEFEGFQILSRTTFLPYRRYQRRFRFRTAVLQMALWLADAFWQGGDVISVWARRGD